MESEQRIELIKLQQEASAILDAGARLAVRAAERPLTGRDRARLCSEALGGALSQPAHFWAGAALIESSHDTGVEPLALAVRMAATRMAVGDLSFVRESLIGQASWASVLAIKLAAQADGEGNTEKMAVLIKLALLAQRQAAAALATAAALNKLVDADSVAMLNG
jgi:hypothetical protein